MSSDGPDRDRHSLPGQALGLAALIVSTFTSFGDHIPGIRGAELTESE
jgi:hypothetical protein